MTYRWPDLSWLDDRGARLPRDSLWGVANAGFQAEGGFNGPDQAQNNWAEWGRSGKVPLAAQADRFWEDAERHLDLAAAMGLNAFRLSLERLLLSDPVSALPSYVDGLYAGDGRRPRLRCARLLRGAMAHYLRLPFTGDWRSRRSPSSRSSGRPRSDPTAFGASFWRTPPRTECRSWWRRTVWPPVGATAGRGHVPTDGPRPAFLRAHVVELLEAARAGAPVAGYLHWTLADNYEWGSYEPRFGLHGVDRTAGIRITDMDAAGEDSAGAYRTIVQAIRNGSGEEVRAALRP